MSKGKGRRREGHPARQSGAQPAAQSGSRRRTQAVEVAVFQVEGYSGPTPHQSTISGYQAAIPNGGERLMTLVEKEQQHRHLMDRRELRADFIVYMSGSIFGFLLALAVIIVGYKLVQDGHDVAGYATLLAGASGLIGSVVVGARRASSG